MRAAKRSLQNEQKPWGNQDKKAESSKGTIRQSLTASVKVKRSPSRAGTTCLNRREYDLWPRLHEEKQKMWDVLGVHKDTRKRYICMKQAVPVAAGRELFKLWNLEGCLHPLTPHFHRNHLQIASLEKSNLLSDVN